MSSSSSAIRQDLLPTLPTPQWSHLPPSSLIHQTPSANETGRIIFTRQLWQRTMPDGNQCDQSVSNKSQAQENRTGGNNIASGAAGPSSSRRTSSSVSSRSQRRSPSPARSGSKTPLTPEESPPFRRKRNADIVEEEDKELEGGEAIPGTIDSGVHVCICQPDPKIPRPRNGTFGNAFSTWHIH